MIPTTNVSTANVSTANVSTRTERPSFGTSTPPVRPQQTTAMAFSTSVSRSVHSSEETAFMGQSSYILPGPSTAPLGFTAPAELQSSAVRLPPHLITKTPIKKRKIRHNFTPHQRSYLEANLEQNKFPGDDTLNAIANTLKLDKDTIRNWFRNRRRKPQKIEREAPFSQPPSEGIALMGQSSYTLPGPSTAPLGFTAPAELQSSAVRLPPHLTKTPIKKRKTRHIFTPHQRSYLEAQLEQNKFPGDDTLNAIANTLKLDKDTIRNWFRNRRRKPQKIEREAPFSQPPPEGIALMGQSSYTLPGPSTALPVYTATTERQSSADRLSPHLTKTPIKKRKPSHKFTLNELAVLEAHFEQNQRPVNDTLEAIANTLKLGKDTIRNWFQNKRAKLQKIEREAPFSQPPSEGIALMGQSSYTLPGPSTALLEYTATTERQSSAGRLPPHLTETPIGKRKTKHYFTPNELTVLEAHFGQNKYLTYDTLITIASTLNLDNDTIRNWFQNRRAELLKIARQALSSQPSSSQPPPSSQPLSSQPHSYYLATPPTSISVPAAIHQAHGLSVGEPGSATPFYFQPSLTGTSEMGVAGNQYDFAAALPPFTELLNPQRPARSIAPTPMMPQHPTPPPSQHYPGILTAAPYPPTTNPDSSGYSGYN